MTVETFFANFGHLADAPNGVQKLRELILQLAVQGKLVPQDPEDEPASVLLERIEAEKKKLIAAKEIRTKKIVAINDSPFELPESWAWVPIGSICRDWGQKVPDQQFSYIDVSAIDNEKGVVAEPAVTEAVDAPSRARKLVQLGTVIYSTVRPYLLNIAVIDKEFEPEAIASTAFAIVHPLGGVSSQYIFWFLRSPVFVGYVESKMLGVAYPAINDSQFFSGLFPLPPLKEQKRIVAKVDQLMALCDELEARQQKQQQVRVRLNNAALDGLLTAREPDEFADHWQRICTNFDLLYDHPETITKLRAAILQLAVQGKLVPQDPNDEPASVLLERIRAEKERLVKEGVIKALKKPSSVSAEEMPFKVPTNWTWARLAELTEVITKGSSPKWQGVQYVDEGKGILFITSENVGSFGLRLDKRKYVESSFNEIEPRSILKKGDVLMNIVGASIGRTAVYDIDDVANINQAVCLIRFVGQGSLNFLRYFLTFFNTPTCISYMFDKQVDNPESVRGSFTPLVIASRNDFREPF
ncbi:restriction endonuclease subunit S [Geothermobacter hydrogeniphilus]|uniref:Restriction endonuclease subunit S n=1 Tax=Geothermobacter hydrogeniphilus TaxID=1969733 RepID=A0A2K2H6H7_9BACT|nr:restriction endonuclease subunit S [Geothermobacter hydrogeniphilus]PNU18924.1 restriction endonuclease subunit S [Geothermobacter hydrogeniphilus]